MSDKQLINSAEDCVDESLYGFSKLQPHLFVDFERKIVLDPKCSSGGIVAVISGGGSGHEPFPAGYVGEGMLTASVSGSLFASPPARNVLHCIRLAAAGSSGVLLLVPNYTGDVLNFGLAAEMALRDGIRVESVTVGDDVALDAAGASSKAGRRGMCGLVLAFKIAGHLARTGCDLGDIARFSADAVRSTASMGLCVSACCKPGVGLLFRLGEDEMEVGVGVHGEAGVGRAKMMSAREAVEMLLEHVLRSLKVVEGDEVVALLNDLGSLSCMEQWLLAGELEGRLSERGVCVVRLYAGRIFTSLNMAGFQICLMKLRQDTKEAVLVALDHPTAASAWVVSTARSAPLENMAVAPPRPQEKRSGSLRLPPEAAQFLRRCFSNISEELKRKEARLNYLDSLCGDGDCGTAFGHAAALLKASADTSDFSDPVTLFSDLCSAIEGSIGGTTGALYGLFLKGCVAELEKSDRLNALLLSKSWRAGVETIKKYSTARIGDRTMLDSLETGCQVFENHLRDGGSTTAEQAFRGAFEAATKGCEGTKYLKASAGRASYVDQSRQNDVDAGAYAVTLWLSAILRAFDDA